MLKTGNGIVTERLPKYTIFCYFAACSGEKRSEVITNESDGYVALSSFANSVHSLETERLLKTAQNGILPIRQRKTLKANYY
jgi:hypothetical protein